MKLSLEASVVLDVIDRPMIASLLSEDNRRGNGQRIEASDGMAL